VVHRADLQGERRAAVPQPRASGRLGDAMLGCFVGRHDQDGREAVDMVIRIWS
jgi:hypothetical protein